MTFPLIVPAAAAGLCMILALFFFPSCDHGLSPEQVQQPGFSGTLHFTSAIPPKDSIVDFRVVAFRSYPPKNILLEVLQGTAVFSEQITPVGTDATFTIQSPTLSGSFAYIAVAQQFGPALDKDWRAVGVYTLTGDVAKPSGVDLQNGIFVPGINIEVNFYHLPPQPF
jgi:hypothetical protein